MNYQEFKDFLVTHLWKNGDTVVINNLDNLIKLANAELDRKLKVEDRNTIAQVYATGTGVKLPDDYKSMVSLSSPQVGDMEYVSQTKYGTLRSRHTSTISKYYTVSKGAIWLAGPISADVTLELTLIYYNKIPDFQAADESWLVDNFFDVYLYCVLKHSAPFLREDERVAMWQAMFSDALESALDENANEVKFAGSPMKMTMRGVR